MEKLKTMENFKIKVLDKGEVELIDYMGSDYSILRSARVSTGGEEKKGDKQDRGLIRYLYTNEHMSPFEQSVFTFRLKAPHFVVKQLLRHRTMCLSGDSKLWFDLPSGPNKGKRKRYNKTIREIYQEWNYGSYGNDNKPLDFSSLEDDQLYTLSTLSSPRFYNRRKWMEKNFSFTLVKASNGKMEKYYSGKSIKEADGKIEEEFNFKREKIKSMLLRRMNEDSKEIDYTNIKDIWKSGVQDVYELELENGYKIKCSKKHPFLTNNGWMRFEEIFDTNNKTLSFSKDMQLYTNGSVAYQDHDYLLQEYWENKKTLKEISLENNVSVHTIRKWIRKLGLQDTNREIKGKLVSWNKGKKYSLDLSDEQKENRRSKARKNSKKGKESNFWKGGGLSRKAEIISFMNRSRKLAFERDGYKCRISGSSYKLEAHHITPVYEDSSPDVAENLDNLITLSKKVHRKIHSYNLEDKLKQYIIEGKDLSNFFVENNKKEDFDEKHETRGRKIIAVLKKIKSVKYVGKEETFDLSVEGDYKNFVCDGFIVHNSFNEFSARYSEALDEVYIPTLWRKQGEKNHQGSGDFFDEQESKEFSDLAQEVYDDIFEKYNYLISKGVSRELARTIIPVSNYSIVYATVDLRNLLHFLELRLHNHAQEEIRVYALAIFSILDNLEKFKWTLEIFQDNILRKEGYADLYEKLKEVNYVESRV